MLTLNDIEFSGDAVAILDGKVVWSNQTSGDCPPDIACRNVRIMYAVSNMIVFELI